jgi:phage terminase large subunit
MTLQPSEEQAAMMAFLDRYEDDWVLLVQEVLGADPDPYQEELLRFVCAASKGQTEQRGISVRSGHGVGKTTGLAFCIVCHLITRFPQKTLCTAPTSTQLFDALAAEVKAWMAKLPQFWQDAFYVKMDAIEHAGAPDESFVTFATSRAETPEALAGKHSEHMLIIGDEASGIPEQVFEAAIGSMSGHNAVTVLAGNPTRSTGLFYDTHNKPKVAAKWKRIHISCEGHPRISQAFLDEVAERYGRDSNAYRVRVLGEFPRGDEDTIIPAHLLDAALTREVTPSPTSPVIWGLDCARSSGGGDDSALAKRKGPQLLGPVQTRTYDDVMQLSGWVKSEYDATDVLLRPILIAIDLIGIGAGVHDRLRELGLPVQGVNVAEASPFKGPYPNLRSEAWFRGKEFFMAHYPSLAGDVDLRDELARTRFTYRSDGKLVAEDKQAQKKRGFKSPNRADAFLLTLLTDAVIGGGTAASAPSNWKTPVSRKLRGIV